MTQSDVSSPLINNAIHLLAASRGRRQFRQTDREFGSMCSCMGGCFIMVIGVLFLLYGPSIVSSIFPQFDFLLLILGFVLFVVGVSFFTGTIRERRRIVKTVEGRDGVSLEVISSEARVPFERAKEYLTNMITAGLLKGSIVDDTYFASMQAEMIDARTVRCPHCDTELELPEEF